MFKCFPSCALPVMISCTWARLAQWGNWILFGLICCFSVQSFRCKCFIHSSSLTALFWTGLQSIPWTLGVKQEYTLYGMPMVLGVNLALIHFFFIFFRLKLRSSHVPNIKELRRRLGASVSQNCVVFFFFCLSICVSGLELTMRLFVISSLYAWWLIRCGTTEMYNQLLKTELSLKRGGAVSLWRDEMHSYNMTAVEGIGEWSWLCRPEEMWTTSKSSLTNNSSIFL